MMAVPGKKPKEGAIEMDGVVTESLPNAMFRVELEANKAVRHPFSLGTPLALSCTAYLSQGASDDRMSFSNFLLRTGESCVGRAHRSEKGTMSWLEDALLPIPETI